VLVLHLHVLHHPIPARGEVLMRHRGDGVLEHAAVGHQEVLHPVQRFDQLPLSNVQGCYPPSFKGWTRIE
jgi:hypothetical protein